MKKFITTLLSLALVIGMCPAMVSAETTLTGEGTSESPYLIATADDLKAARDAINANANGEAAAHYKLTADIVLDANETWIPIAPLNSFTGTFNGDNHYVSNITVVRTNDNVNSFGAKPALGFFGKIEAGTVTNLGLNNVKVANNFTGYGNKTAGMGGFAGYVKGAAAISNCYVKNVTLENTQRDQRQAMGGFIGTVGGSTPVVTNCYVYNATFNSGGTSESDYLGGFVGEAAGLAMNNKNCYVANVTLNIADESTSSFYAFGVINTASSSYKEDTCLSEADDIITSSYNSAKATGTIGMTKAGLVEAMTAVGYVTDASVNDGYPCFDWEVETVATESWDGNAAAAFASGDGSPENPYQITSAAELKLAADIVNRDTDYDRDACFILMNDIDYENNAWEPIGYSNSTFTWSYSGDFDGNEHVIRNLAISTTDTAYTFCGFFGYVVGSEIKDLGIENIQITMTNTSSVKAAYIGGFAGRLRGCTVSNCYVKNSLVKQSAGSGTESYGVAGFVSYLDASSGVASVITNCYVYDVDLYCGYGRAQVGFVAHAEGNAVITNCYADATALRTSNADFPWYGFGYTGHANTAYTEGTTATTSNCYSTLADTNVSATSTFGTPGQSVAQIAGVFASLEGWQDGKNINAGLPALAWEPTPVVYPYVVKQVSLAKGTVTIGVNETATGDKVYIATYDSTDRLMAAEVKDAAASVTTTLTADGVAKIKVFIWNGLTPVIDAVVKDL